MSLDDSKAGFEEKLQEAAEMFLSMEPAKDSLDFKRAAVRILLETAIGTSENPTKAAKKIGVHPKSVERILHNNQI